MLRALAFLLLALFSLPVAAHPAWHGWASRRAPRLPDPTDDEVVGLIRSAPVHFVNTPTLVQWTSTSNTIGDAGSGTSGGSNASKVGDDAISQLDFYLPNPTLGGNAVVVAISAVDVASITISDEGSNTWTRASAGAVTDSGNNQLSVYFALNVAAGMRHITATLATPNINAYLQAGASEWNNIATSSAADGSAGQVVAASTTWTSGSFTTTAAGDLVIAFAMTSGATPWLGASITAGGGFTLVSADIRDGFACEYQVQGAAGAINPSFTVNPSTRAIMIGLALKSAAAGTAAPASAIFVKGIQHNSLDSTAAAAFTIQFPTTGNLFVIMADTVDGLGTGTTAVISSITDGTNSWSVPTGATATSDDTANPVVQSAWVAANATPSTTMTLTVTPSKALFHSRLTAYDIVNAAASPVGTVNATHIKHTTATYFNSNTMTPGDPNSLVIAGTAVEIGSNYQVWGQNFYWDNATYPQQDDGDPNGTKDNHLDRDNANAHAYNVDGSPMQWTWVSTAGLQQTAAAGAGFSASVAIEFKSANNAVPQPYSPLNPGTGPVTITGLVGTVFWGVWTCPVDVAGATVVLQGAGGCGGRGTSATGAAGKGGGKGGDCVVDGSIACSEWQRFVYRVGGGGTNSAGTVYDPCSTAFLDGSNNLSEAKSGVGVANNSNTGATTSSAGNNLISGNVGDTVFTGGNGASGTASGGGGGGGSAGTTGAGGAGAVTGGGSGGSGSPAGVTGGNGKASGSNGAGGNANAPGGGGGGCFWVSGTQAAGTGGPGVVTITPNYPSTGLQGTLPEQQRGRHKAGWRFQSGGGTV